MTISLKTSSRPRSALLWAGSLLLATMLVACGGQSQKSSSVTPSDSSTGSVTPTNPPASASTPSLAEQITALERSGAYPALDRSSDVAGPDANKNGVRDDIEAWINAQPVTDPQRKALMQDARAIQQTLLVDLTDKAALQHTGEGLAASGHCGLLQFSPYATFSKLSDKIEAMTANTKERAMRYIQYNAARSGSSTTSPRGDTCEP